MNYKEERYTLDFPEMECQHEYLYSLFDKLEQFDNTTDKRIIRHHLDEMERYILFHFASEEQLMKLYKYPGFAVHQTEHEQFGNKLVQFLDDFDAGKLNIAALRIFATGWLMDHSKLGDSEYVVWIVKIRNEIWRIS
jgi:hemerythrin-like metal-binding protein